MKVLKDPQMPSNAIRWCNMWCNSEFEILEKHHLKSETLKLNNPLDWIIINIHKGCVNVLITGKTTYNT